MVSARLREAAKYWRRSAAGWRDLAIISSCLAVAGVGAAIYSAACRAWPMAVVTVLIVVVLGLSFLTVRRRQRACESLAVRWDNAAAELEASP